MKRMLKIAVVFAILGAIASAVIAITVSAWDREMMIDPLLTAALRRAAWREAESRGQADVDTWIERAFSDSFGEVVITSGLKDGDGTPLVVYDMRFGWPLRSMEARTTVKQGTKPWQASTGGGMRLRKKLMLSVQLLTAPKSPFQEIDRVLPFLPIWPGFAINSIVLGFGLWAALFVLGLPVRLTRAVRGRCSACGYLSGSSPICTECGRKLRRVRPTTRS